MNMRHYNMHTIETSERRRRVLAFFTAIAALASMLAGCANPFANAALSAPISISGFKLNTYVEIRGYDRSCTEELLQSALALCDKYEKMFSRTMENSSLWELNRSHNAVISHELGELIEYGITYAKLSGGSFDISIGAVSSLWDFTADTPQIPAADALSKASASVNYQNINISKNADGTYNIAIPEDMTLDLGAIAKGYIADRIKDFLIESGVKSALINLGGNVLCVGSKPDKSGYSINVRLPFGGASDYLCRLVISDMSVVTSGTYERCFTYNGALYHHMLNPRTGYPYDNDLNQVTIISENSVTGDCLSTACFTLGLENGLKLIEETDGIEAIFVTKDNVMHLSSGAAKYIL